MAPDASGKREKILKIYSILKTYRSELDETSTWAIAETIMGESERYSLDPILVLASIKVESNFHPEALSSEGARGLMQIRPFVAQTLAEKVELDQWEGERSLDDPILNIKLGVFYINYLKKRFRDLEVALSAYNRGPTAIQSRLEYEEPIPLGYATKVLSAYEIYRNEGRALPKSLDTRRRSTVEFRPAQYY
jgi:soluble lytic murein transglycosylase